LSASRAFSGGAPINVAYHLQKLGLTAYPVTAVGSIFGHELIRTAGALGFDTRFVNILPDKQTGVVRASNRRQCEVRDVEDVAWD
jgi:fructokinase